MATAMIPFTHPHGGIVIGSGGKTIKALMGRFGCFIEAQKAQPLEGRPLPYFVVRGPHQKAVNQATIEIYRLLTTSMMNGEKKLKMENETLGSKLEHADMSAIERNEKLAELVSDVDFLTEQLAKERSGEDSTHPNAVKSSDTTAAVDAPKKEKHRPGPILTFDSDESGSDTDDDDDDGITMNGKH